MLTLDMEGDRRFISPGSGYGLLWGVAAFTNPAALAFLPASGLWLAYQLPGDASSRSCWLVVVAAVVFWLTLMPWLVRNYEVFHKPVFVRDNAAIEFRCGNNPLAEGMWVVIYHPSQNFLLFEQYKQHGELAYAAEHGTPG